MSLLPGPWLLLACALAASAAPGQPAIPQDAGAARAEAQPAPPPLALESSAYEAALRVSLEAPDPLAEVGLHNLFRLSPAIVSGGEPEGEQAFAALERLGVKTILSVDGKVPDAEAAARHGMRYVHVPIQYKGITADELLKIAKTFREQEGPFYVHCFHGQHRGPAAAAVGRVLLDGAGRDQALAEMRQWCGTSSKYEGLYKSIALDQLPTVEQTEAYPWDFPAAAPLEGLGSFMVLISRPFDRLKDFAKRGWQVDPDHPDLDPVNEAAILAGLLERVHEVQDEQARGEDFAGWMSDVARHTASLEQAFEAARAAGGQQEDWATVAAALERVDASCSACHKVYRDL